MSINWRAPSRREILTATISAAAAVAVAPLAAVAAPAQVEEEIKKLSAGKAIVEGKIKLDLPSIAENGLVVPLNFDVESPMTEADHVKAIAIFNVRNPQRDVVVFRLTPRAGRAHVGTRIRLATSQQLVAVAQMSDGSCWQQTVDVIVTLAACVES